MEDQYLDSTYEDQFELPWYDDPYEFDDEWADDELDNPFDTEVTFYGDLYGDEEDGDEDVATFEIRFDPNLPY